MVYKSSTNSGSSGSGTVTSVSGTANRITVANGTTTPVVDISAAYVGQSSITTLGTIASGTWNGAVIGPAFGGTGVANNASSTITISGSFGTTLTVTGTTSVTLPTSGTLAKIGGTTTISASAIDWSLNNTFSKSIGSTNTTFTFSNTTDGQSITVLITATTGTVTWPSTKWSGGVAPTQTVSGTDIYTFIKVGSTFYGSVVGNFS